jgi:putative SOS response-associated peptidase YedK
MCGRFTLTVSSEVLAEHFGLEAVPPLEPRFNIAPTQAVAVVWVRPARQRRELAILQWGLIPSWAEDPTIGSRLINARAETVSEKPAFRVAFKYRRCLMLADGFYEWKGKGKYRQPYYFRLKDGRPFAFAGLWEHWMGADGSDIETCALITTEANPRVRSIHERMPVILRPEDYDFWLDPKPQDPRRLQELLRPYPAEAMTAYPVTPRVNSPFEDEADFITPLDLPVEDSTFPLV